MRAVLADVALKIRARVDQHDPVDVVPRNPVAEHDRLRVGREHHGAEHVDRVAIDLLAEHPRPEVRHVADRIGAVLGARPDVALDHHGAVALGVVVAAQRFEMRLEERAVAGRAIDRRHQRVGAGQVEAAAARGLAAVAVVEKVDAHERDANGVRGCGAARQRRRQRIRLARSARAGLARPVHSRRRQHIAERTLALGALGLESGLRRGQHAGSGSRGLECRTRGIDHREDLQRRGFMGGRRRRDNKPHGRKGRCQSTHEGIRSGARSDTPG